jgi:hypothetical protein
MDPLQSYPGADDGDGDDEFARAKLAVVSNVATKFTAARETVSSALPYLRACWQSACYAANDAPVFLRDTASTAKSW